MLQKLREYFKQRDDQARLMQLTDRELRDIGISRSEIPYVTKKKCDNAS